MMHGLAPGPFLFRNHAVTMYAIMFGFVLTNVLMYLSVRLLARWFVHITRVPEPALIAVLFVICMAGAYCGNGSWFDVMVTIAVGIAAYFLTRMNVPMIPFILGFILGPTIETNFRKALIMSDGSAWIFVTRPICMLLILLTVVMLAGTKWMNRSMAADRE